ncbi:TPA: hypothetical protein DD690_02365 [Candidatus Daviesbacteria bacterium]|nr:MAG: hypothetical protein A3D02_02025 [Candidatus Daviesbacteria bacterium RIFCSPHIGHO2_02_FULL_39_41]OGE45156.1 MAG: hypothetical protein A3E67_03040 [Candidatus Daviesbacteria bacterium RIFCSPHIGHO2_12_FULL_38_25]OGE68347.1 MAG: hypothetical protein A3H81_02315 [Candidatus Daviesbacteria bacterium RIFCSPLOWO2_02_FULL_38_18]OGE72144.1 MAG: hypothetical protein A3H18_01470 [Candidatus Daviesbacteria bacterium RIFCSPLOWO2_12_FULL_38_10]HBQ50800.1 hypothetical protein [Candidatus Daviesbacteri
MTNSFANWEVDPPIEIPLKERLAIRPGAERLGWIGCSGNGLNMLIWVAPEPRLRLEGTQVIAECSSQPSGIINEAAQLVLTHNKMPVFRLTVGHENLPAYAEMQPLTDLSKPPFDPQNKKPLLLEVFSAADAIAIKP